MSIQDFQKSERDSNRQVLAARLLIGIILLLVLLSIVAANYYLVPFLPEGAEFALLRTSSQSFLFNGENPYSGDIPARVQAQVYGRSALPGEDQYILDIPFYILIGSFPFAIILDAQIARALWMTLIEIGLAGFIFLSYRILNRSIPIKYIASLMIASFTSLYAYHSLIEGSLAIFLAFGFVGILILLRYGMDEFAGALIVLSSYQWEIGALFLLFILIWVIWERRWGVFIGIAMLMFILQVISSFWYPGWIMPFLRAAWQSYRTGFGFSTHEIIKNFSPEYGAIAAWIITAILVVTLLFEWSLARNAKYNRFLWVVCLTMAITPLIGFSIELHQLVVLILPIMLVITISREHWFKKDILAALFNIMIFFGIPWLLFLLDLPDKNTLIFLFLPISSVIGLYWIRWWMFRLPRNWSERISNIE